VACYPVHWSSARVVYLVELVVEQAEQINPDDFELVVGVLEKLPPVRVAASDQAWVVHLVVHH
jgi:hypothetical protein